MPKKKEQPTEPQKKNVIFHFNNAKEILTELFNDTIHEYDDEITKYIIIENKEYFKSNVKQKNIVAKFANQYQRKDTEIYFCYELKFDILLGFIKAFKITDKTLIFFFTYRKRQAEINSDMETILDCKLRGAVQPYKKIRKKPQIRKRQSRGANNRRKKPINIRKKPINSGSI